MIQSLVTVVIPFPRRREGDVNRRLGDPLQREAIRVAIETTYPSPFVHFMSMVVVEAEDEAWDAHLLIELCADGHPSSALRKLACAIPGQLDQILVAAGKEVPLCQQPRFLQRHSRSAGPLHWNAGLMFRGTPDLSVTRIRRERDLACRIAKEVQNLPPSSAMEKLQAVRKAIFEDPDFKWAFISEPMSRVVGPGKPISTLTIAWAAFRDFGWVPVFLLPTVAFIVSRLAGRTALDVALWHSFATFLVLGLFCGLAALIGYWILRRDEKCDVPVDENPKMEALAKILAGEDNTGVQNHLFGISVMKASIVRGFTLRLALWFIERGAKDSRPGYLDKIGSIHFARWIRLRGTDQLVFLSNYDGSWESYLEDFIARLRDGLSSVWSNTRDFPKTENLIKGGAGDGARFKRWARRQQRPTRFWYGAYPELTAHRIRTHAQIRHGFAGATTEAEAAHWLSHFGHAGRASLELQEIPTLAFGGLPKLPYAHCFVVTLPAADRAKDWLAAIQRQVTYGDRMPSKTGLVVGFSAAGIEKLELKAPAIATFPIAFREGMAHERRAAALGDKPNDWLPVWKPEGVDALLLLYDDCLMDLERQVLERSAELRSFGCTIKHSIRTSKAGSTIREAFGFIDGVSQPVMRGTIRGSRDPTRMDVVQPGELVLGYEDNLGVIAPTPMAAGRDIGRNGTFLVVRQIEQDPLALQNYLQGFAQDLIARKDPKVPTYDPALLEEWLAAKMVGRWRDGTSLVRHPNQPGSARIVKTAPDNSFMFGREDPDGLRCPFGAHVRRANPRESFEPGSPEQIGISNRHRILRVGRNYAPQGAQTKPGLLFMCVNADIERQFEFLQQSWILGANFHGLDNEIDPIVGCSGNGLLVPTPHGPLRLPALRNFVKVLGGAYFFLPSRSALKTLAQKDPVQPATAAAAVAAA